MKQANDEVAGLLWRVLAYVLAWLGSWKLGEVQQVVGIFSALVIAGVGMLNGYVIWRDKIHRKRAASQTHR